MLSSSTFNRLSRPSNSLASASPLNGVRARGLTLGCILGLCFGRVLGFLGGGVWRSMVGAEPVIGGDDPQLNGYQVLADIGKKTHVRPR